MVLIYVTVRSWKSSFINLMGTEWFELSAPIKKKKTVKFDFVYTESIIFKYRPVSTKLGQNIYIQQILNEFNHRSDCTGTTRVICSWIGKNCYIRLCLLSGIYKYKPISTKLGHNEYEHGSQMSLIMGQVIPDQWVLSALEIEKLNFSNLFDIYFHCYPVLFSTQVSNIGPSWSSCFNFFFVSLFLEDIAVEIEKNFQDNIAFTLCDM